MKRSLLSLAAALFAVTGASLFQPLPRAQVCNGREEYCDRQYSNVSLIGTHDSAFVGNLDDPRVDQEKSMTEQLDAGIRFLQAQTHLLVKDVSFEDNLSMCHTSCFELYAGSLRDYLSTIKTWLDSHPDDVVTLLLTNGDSRPVEEFAAVFQSVGMDKYAFIPATSPAQLPMDQWPTYGDLISSNKRLVMFLDYGANESSVPYILDEFKYFFETPFTQTDPNFSQCNLDRPAGASPAGRMYIVNHTLNKALTPLTPDVLVPDNDADSVSNAAMGQGSIGAQADLCLGKWGRVPNVILVDMFDRGDVFTAQNTLNGF